MRRPGFLLLPLRRFILLLGTVTLAGVVWLAAQSTAGQQPPPAAPFPPYRATHMADGHPDLNGIWQAFVTANFDIQDHEAQPGPHPEIMGAYGAEPAGQSIVEGGEIPYQPWALAKKKENFDEADDGRRQQRQDVARARAIRSSSATCPACRARPTCRFRFRSCRARARTS